MDIRKEQNKGIKIQDKLSPWDSVTWSIDQGYMETSEI